MRVEVYWNLHKQCFSVRALEGPDRGRVIHHSTRALLTGVTFVVQPAGRDRVLREGRKNVHAFVRGTLEAVENVALFDDSGPAWTGLHTQHVEGCRSSGAVVTYNPYQGEAFMALRPLKDSPDQKSRLPIHDAFAVALERRFGRPVLTAWNEEAF